MLYSVGLLAVNSLTFWFVWKSLHFLKVFLIGIESQISIVFLLVLYRYLHCVVTCIISEEKSVVIFYLWSSVYNVSSPLLPQSSPNCSQVFPLLLILAIYLWCALVCVCVLNVCCAWDSLSFLDSGLGVFIKIGNFLAVSLNIFPSPLLLFFSLLLLLFRVIFF